MDNSQCIITRRTLKWKSVLCNSSSGSGGGKNSSNTYVNNGFTRLMHVRNDAVGENQQNEVVTAWHTRVWCNSATQRIQPNYSQLLIYFANKIKRLNEWKENVESKGMRVNMNKTKVMISGERQMVWQKAARWPCGVCNNGVGSNSLQCTTRWVKKKTRHQTLAHNFTKYWPIFKILFLVDSLVNLQLTRI